MQKGNSLIISLTFIMVLSIISATLIIVSKSYEVSYEIMQRNIRSKYVAKTGLSIAVSIINKYGYIYEIQGNVNNLESIIIREDPNEDIWNELIKNGKGNQNQYRHGFTYNNRKIAIDQRQSYDYRVVIEKYGDGYIAYSYGVFEKKVYSLKGYIFKKEMLKCEGIFGVKSLEFLGWGAIDSYDSSLGPYGENNKSSKALIGSDKNILLSDLFTIYGDMKLGKNGKINLPSHIYGNISYKEMSIIDIIDDNWLNAETISFTNNQKNIKDMTVHYDKINLNSSLVISGKNIIYCHGDFVATDKSEIQFENDAVLHLYIGGNFIFKGKLQYQNHNPLQFQIISICNDKSIVPSKIEKNILGGWSVTITPLSDFKCFLYAPFSNVYFKSEKHFMGAITAYRAKIISEPENRNQANIHYDRALEKRNETKNYVYVLKGIQTIYYKK